MRVLVLGCTAATSWGRDQLTRLAVQARSRGITLIGADTADKLAAAHPDELASVDETVELDVRDPAACRAWARTATGIDAVMTVHELSVLCTAVVAAELGLPGNDPDVITGIRTKDVCRERLRESGFRQPVTAVCRTRADAAEFMRANAGPWVVKPRDGLGSSGVSLLRDVGDLPAAMATLANVAASLGKFGGASKSDAFLIETFVDGPEFSAEGVVLGGAPQVLALTSKKTNDRFIETGHRVPALLDGAATVLATETVEKGVAAAGVTHGVFHVEFWLTDDGVVLGEVHARQGGDYIHALVEHSRPGLELYGLLLDDLLGRPTAPVPPQTRAAGSEFLLLPPGRLHAVAGWQEIVDHPRTLAADLLVGPGATLGPIADSLDRHGVIAAGADALPAVDEALGDLTSRLVVDIDRAA